MMENTVPFLLAWEAYVFFMLCMFLSIIWRLHRLEWKVNKLLKRPRRSYEASKFKPRKG